MNTLNTSRDRKHNQGSLEQPDLRAEKTGAAAFSDLVQGNAGAMSVVQVLLELKDLEEKLPLHAALMDEMNIRGPSMYAAFVACKENNGTTLSDTDAAALLLARLRTNDSSLVDAVNETIMPRSPQEAAVIRKSESVKEAMNKLRPYQNPAIFLAADLGVIEKNSIENAAAAIALHAAVWSQRLPDETTEILIGMNLQNTDELVSLHGEAAAATLKEICKKHSLDEKKISDLSKALKPHVLDIAYGYPLSTDKVGSVRLSFAFQDNIHAAMWSVALKANFKFPYISDDIMAVKDLVSTVLRDPRTLDADDWRREGWYPVGIPNNYFYGVSRLFSRLQAANLIAPIEERQSAAAAQFLAGQAVLGALAGVAKNINSRLSRTDAGDCIRTKVIPLVEQALEIRGLTDFKGLRLSRGFSGPGLSYFDLQKFCHSHMRDVGGIGWELQYATSFIEDRAQSIS